MMPVRIFFQSRQVIWLVVVAGLFGIFWFLVPPLSQHTPFPYAVRVGETSYALEIAATDAERALGLGERERLCSGCAMLFLFETKARHAFWMKGMQFPIDMVWLNDNTVVHIERRVSPESSETYTPSGDANQVLEANGGSFDDLDVGERVKFLFLET